MDEFNKWFPAFSKVYDARPSTLSKLEPLQYLLKGINHPNPRRINSLKSVRTAVGRAKIEAAYLELASKPTVNTFVSFNRVNSPADRAAK